MSFFKTLLARPYILLGVCLIAILGYAKFIKSGPSQAWQMPTKVVEAQVVKKQDIRRCVLLMGIVKPRQSTQLLVMASGVLKLHARPGERVAKGALLASIENSDIEKKYGLAQEAERIAKDRYDRAFKLHETMSISHAALEDKKAVWLEAQRSLYDAKTAYEHLQIIAPFEGVVGSFRATEGSQVQTGERIASFYDPQAFRLDFDVPSSVLMKVKPDASVGVDGNWYSLTHVDKMIQEETHMAKAYVDLPSSSMTSERALGTTVDLELCLEEKKGVLVVPFESIFFQNGKTCIYKLVDETTQVAEVEMGVRYKENVEVVKGLFEGDLIVVRGQNRLYPGLKVEVKRIDENS